MAQSDSVPARAGEYKHQITATIEKLVANRYQEMKFPFPFQTSVFMGFI